MSKPKTVTLHYEYNAQGRLARRSRNGVHERVFLWDGDQLLAELDSGGTKRVGEYVYMPGTVDHPFAFIDTTVTLLGISQPSVSYYGLDGQANVLGLVRSDSSGARDVRQQYTYDELGLQTIGVDSLPQNRLGWKGLIYEGDSTRLYYVRNRWYDPAQGRFMSEDPSGLSGGLNLYAFGGADPINSVDPYGQSQFCLYNFQYFVDTFTLTAVTPIFCFNIPDGAPAGPGVPGGGSGIQPPANPPATPAPTQQFGQCVASLLKTQASLLLGDAASAVTLISKGLSLKSEGQGLIRQFRPAETAGNARIAAEDLITEADLAFQAGTGGTVEAGSALVIEGSAAVTVGTVTALVGAIDIAAAGLACALLH